MAPIGSAQSESPAEVALHDAVRIRGCAHLAPFIESGIHDRYELGAHAAVLREVDAATDLGPAGPDLDWLRSSVNYLVQRDV